MRDESLHVRQPRRQLRRGGYLGVNRDGSRWTANVTVDGKMRHLGSFATPEEAARCRDNAAVRVYGPNTRLNFPAEPVAPAGARLVQLTHGQWAVVDDDVYPAVAQWKWQAIRGPLGCWYARRAHYHDDGRIEYRLMHREILGLIDGPMVDHRDGNCLNNRRSNLRACSHLQNSRNTKLNQRNKSGFKGVSWSTAAGKWRASLCINKRQTHLGVFECAEDAARAYDAAAAREFGEFARTNRLMGLLKEPDDKAGAR